MEFLFSFIMFYSLVLTQFYDGSLHWNGGMRVLSKARAVKEFSVFESAPAGAKKAVFIISGGEIEYYGDV